MRVAIVTGANKGIGLELVKQLLKFPHFDRLYLTSRDEKRGKDAMDLARKSVTVDKPELVYHQLDMTIESSVEAFAKTIKDVGGFDLLVNNAGFAYKNDATEPFHVQARDSIDINFYGTMRVCKALAPLGKRIVNVGSMAGQSVCRALSQDKFDMLCESESRLKKETDETRIIEFLEKFCKDVQHGDPTNFGYGKSAYGMSKMGLMMYTQFLSCNHHGGAVCSVCPGWCKTDMAGHEKPPLTAAEGASRIMQLCEPSENGWKLDDNSVNGNFFSNEAAAPAFIRK